MSGFDFDFTLAKFKECVGGNPPNAEHWYEALCEILPDYDINTVPRVAAFLAQTAHESGGYRAIKENLNYKAESLCRVWPRYFNSSNAAQYAHNQQAIANRAYANRMGNGDEASGDGWKFCGRGLIQLTGKDNYRRYAESLEISLDEASEHLTTFEGCVQSAAWFWEANNLNQYADSGDILTMTKRINGGTLGLADRQKHYTHAIHVLGG